MADIVLNVEVREKTGTGEARTARRAGLVPGVLYGGDLDPVAISVKANEFRKALYTGKLLGHLVTLKFGDETIPVPSQRDSTYPFGQQALGTFSVTSERSLEVVTTREQTDSPSQLWSLR